MNRKQTLTIETISEETLSLATALSKRLQQIDQANAVEYAKHGDGFSQRWRQAMARWNAQGEPHPWKPEMR